MRNAFKGMSVLGVLLMVMIGAGYFSSQGVFTKRYWASYKPGDCLRTPALDANTERWDTQREPDTILMVSEVGNKSYHTREWGRRFSNFPQWYASYNVEPFWALDESKQWSPIPCPEQGPDPEQASTASLDDSVSNGRVIFGSSTDGFTVESNTFESNTLDTRNGGNVVCRQSRDGGLICKRR